MERHLQLSDLLSSHQEPREASYRQACTEILSSTDILTKFNESSDESFFLACLTDHGHRFTNLLSRLFRMINTRKPSFPLHRLASATSALLMRIIRTLRDFNVELLTSIIAPALETCLTSGVREGQSLATLLINHEGVVKRLINTAGGAGAISSWTYSPVIHHQDEATLAAWTNQLASWIQLCPSMHGLRDHLCRWDDLGRLMSCLRIDRDRYAELTDTTKRATHKPSLVISTESTVLLNRFDLMIPESSRKLSEITERLEKAKTIAIMQPFAESFPCCFCKDTLQRGATIGQDNTTTANSSMTPMLRFGMEIFGHSCGTWEVLLSTPALSNLLALRQSRASCTVEEMLFVLANGQRHTEGLAGSKPIRQLLKVPLFLNYCGVDRFIVWQVDVDISYETKVSSQIIRVWDIVKASEIDILVEHVAVVQSQWTPKKANRCRQGPINEKNQTVPVIFNKDVHDATTDFRKQVGLDVRSRNQYFFRLIGKFFPFTEAFVHPQELKDVSPDYPYKLSPFERDIVCHSYTGSIIIGRSGTGKTTCLLYKLIGRNLASKRFGDDSSLKQVLLTKSGELAAKIRHDVRRLLATILPGLALDVGQADLRGDGKPTFFRPPHAMYPYVCTFEEFLQRLENTVALAEAVELHNPRLGREMPNGQAHDNDQVRFGEVPEYCVDFSKFKEYYWPQLDRLNHRKLPLALVFAEIMGVIKGSTECATTLRALTCSEYLNRSSRISPVFDSDVDRSAVYQMYQAYENQKREVHELDYVDRVLGIFGFLQRTPDLNQVLAAAIDEIYVDEVQDQRSVDLELLLKLIKDGRYFHAAGDTAQAISQESTFRFEDLKAMIYERFTDNTLTGKQGQERPEVFQLGLNYRSHHGIVKFGSMVMDLLWRTFPQTVDKLVPEEGLLCGPIPFMFVGCERDVLTKATLAGSKEAPADKAKFGAEQVVLVRDEESKARLKSSIGDIALILTILQSKGMEFDDVVLFDFFTSCPEPDGWRTLPDLANNEAREYDSKRYASMCVELKQLYVAVTRARTKLFLMETTTSECLAPIIRLLSRCEPGPVVQVIRREDTAFGEKLELLRADKSTDPKRWIERGYDLLADEHLREALHCFEQADYKLGMKFVNAKIKRAQGNACFAKNDTMGAMEAYEASIALFLDIRRTEDAVRICRKMGWLERAARLWADAGEDYKAARAFSDAKLYLRAAESYEYVQMYTEAAEVLWKGKEFNELVRCLVGNREVLPAPVLSMYVSLCKIPLKQKKLTPQHRKQVISLLGSPQEREQVLRRYEINDVLEEFLLEGKRYDDLFDLKLRLGQIDSALELLVSRNKAGSSVGTRDQVEQLIHFTVISRLWNKGRRRKMITSKLLNDLRDVAIRDPIRQWSAAIACLKDDSRFSTPRLDQLENEVMKVVTSLLVLDPDFLRNMEHFEDLLSSPLQQAITTVRDTLAGEEGQVSTVLLTVCGVWKTGNPQQPHIILPWSPLSKAPPPKVSDGLVSAAKAWVAVRFTQSIWALHDISKHLWKSASPLRCAQFLKGYCPRGQKCPWVHQHATPDNCSTTIKHLVSLNSIFCGLTTLYYRKVMDENFQSSFLKMRRVWQEHLVRATTWVSAFEQDVAAINNLLVRIRYDEGLSNVAAGLEALLFFRLRREWTERNSYSSLVEQLQLATALGVEVRFFRVFRHITASKNQGEEICQQLSLLKNLEGDAIEMNAPAFRKNIAKLEDMLKNKIKLDGFSAFHSVTSMLEFLATYLIFRTCGTDFVIPRSWLYLHVPRLYEIVGSNQVPATAAVTHRSTYQECFHVLIQTLRNVLQWLDTSIPPNHRFQNGKSDYLMSLIRPRNAELLAVSLLNFKLSAIETGALPEFPKHEDEVRKVLKLDRVNQAYLRCSGGAASVCQQIARSYDKYKGKNELVVIKRGPASHLQDVHNIQRMSIAQLLALESRFRPTLPSAQKLPQPGPSEVFKAEDLEAIKKIQSWWRSRQYLQQSLMKQVKDWQLSRFKLLMATCPDGILRSGLRFFYLSRGFETLSELAKAKDRLASTHTSIMSACEVMTEASAYEALDRALTRILDIERSLDSIAGAVSDSELRTIIGDGEFSKIRPRFDEVDTVIKQAHQGFEEIEAVLKEAYKSAAAAAAES
ncbi:MAG: hypothetical protein LQ349_003074 [Xanthoria aureola]|nr:MAG: hypothetical protein LQ349_003074 [Xanthoria aureola]